MSVSARLKCDSHNTFTST